MERLEMGLHLGFKEQVEKITQLENLKVKLLIIYVISFTLLYEFLQSDLTSCAISIAGTTVPSTVDGTTGDGTTSGAQGTSPGTTLKKPIGGKAKESAWRGAAAFRFTGAIGGKCSISDYIKLHDSTSYFNIVQKYECYLFFVLQNRR